MLPVSLPVFVSNSSSPIKNTESPSHRHGFVYTITAAVLLLRNIYAQIMKSDKT